MVVLVFIAIIIIVWQAGGRSGSNLTTVVSTPTHATYTPPSSPAIAALPEAKYDAVIPGLIPYSSSRIPTSIREYSLSTTTALYGEHASKPVARLAAMNFLQEPTVVVALQRNGPWTLILTPARAYLPSQHGGDAPAQTAAWVRTSALRRPSALPDRVVVSVSKQTLTITRPHQRSAVYSVGVGAPHTPTPTNVVGYIQARYLDPAQDESVYPIQLTSLHSSVADEPYGGKDGGLIGVHYYPERNGAISHGCIRLPVAAITAVNSLPLGTPVLITP